VEQNRKAGQNPPRVVAPIEEEEEEEEDDDDEAHYKPLQTRRFKKIIYDQQHHIKTVLKHHTPKLSNKYNTVLIFVK
jgi:hypothetical protein